MTVWLDAQLSPGLARWLTETFAVEAIPVRDVGLREAEDERIFLEARKLDIVVITKDADFAELLEKYGSPPRIIWLTCGNTSETALRGIFTAKFPEAMRLITSGENLVEISSE